MDAADLTASQARAALGAGELGCVEYAQAVVSRLRATEELNAILWADEEALLRQAAELDRSGAARRADLPLAGLPLLLKDNIDTTALPTTAGTRALRGLSPPRDAPVARALFDAGALLAGKANMHELAFGITSNNAATGAVRNPWDLSRIPGGSSGGSAAAVAARIVPAALGTDTGASVRLPAALCGVVGFRPSAARYPGAGIVPISHTRDTAGPITRSVDDAILIDRVITGNADLPEIDLRGVRLGVPRRACYEGADTQVLAVVEAALRRLADAGVQLVEAEIPGLEVLNAAVGFPVALYELAQDIPAYLRANGYALSLAELAAQIASPDVAGIVMSQLGGQAVSAMAYDQAMNARLQLQAAYAQYLRSHNLDAIVFPTAVLPACPIGEDETVELNGERLPTFATYIRNTDPGSNAGIPGISLPAGLTPAGLPVGIELDGPAGGDRRLLALAHAVEALLPRLPRPLGI